MFKQLSSANLEVARDVVFNGQSTVKSDIYTATVKMAYGTQSERGALGIVLTSYLEELGKEHTETIWVSNREGKNYSIDKESKKKRPLPGFTVINDLCAVTIEKELSELDTETKLVPVYNFDEKKQVPTEVEVLTELLGAKFYVAILEKEVNKQQKQASGEYAPIAESHKVNSIEKIMHYPTKVTLREAEDGNGESVYYDAWLEANKGKVIDKRTIKDGAPTTGSVTHAPTAQKAAPTKSSLFGKKS